MTGDRFASAEAVIRAARETIGTPWVHQGRLIGQALDCVGVAIHVCRQLDLPYVDLVGYGRSPAFGLLEATMACQPSLSAIEWIDDRRPGDLLLMRFGRCPQHLAILTDADTIVHSWEEVGQACEHRLSPVWQRRIVAVYRFLALQAPSA